MKGLCHGRVVHFVTVNEELLVNNKMDTLIPKKVCFPIIIDISNVTNRIIRFVKLFNPFESSSCFHPCLLLFLPLFIPSFLSFDGLSDYFNVLSVSGSSYCLNFDKCRDVLFKKRAGVYSPRVFNLIIHDCEFFFNGFKISDIDQLILFFFLNN